MGDEALAGLPELSIDGLGDSDARALLLENVYGPLDAAVCDQIVTESHGNPLALLELPRSWRAADLAGGFGLPDSQPVVSKIEQSYVRRLRVLPSETQLLVLAAAAEPLGDPLLLHRAAETLGVDMGAADPAVDAGLLGIGGRVEFAHPLVRSAAYRSAATDDRHRVHRALAEATDPETDPDRRAWHRARATPGPGEEVAAELERSAGRAQARGGVAAAAAFLQRAVALTVDPARRAERALAAAQASFQAGAFDAALGLVATAEAGPARRFPARTSCAPPQATLPSPRPTATMLPRCSCKPQERLEPFDLELARRTYLTAWGAAVTARHLGGAGVLLEICRAVRALPPLPAAPHPLDLLLDGLALLTTDGSRRRDADRCSAQRRQSSHCRWRTCCAGAGSPRPPAPPYGTPTAPSRSTNGQVQLVRDAGALAGAADPPLTRWHWNGVARRLRGRRLAPCGERQRGGGDWEPGPALRGAQAPGIAREGSRGHPVDRGHDPS